MSKSSLNKEIKTMINHNALNYDYINVLTLTLTSRKQVNYYEWIETLTLIYSNINMFEDVFNSITNDTLYVHGIIFNSESCKKLISLIKSNKNINHIKIKIGNLDYFHLSYLNILELLDDIKISFSIPYSYLDLKFNNKFKQFINKHIIYNLSLHNHINYEQYIPHNIENNICNLLTQNKVINLKLKNIDYLSNTFSYSEKLMNALELNKSLKTFNGNFTINDKLYETFKKRNLLSSFIHYENKNDYNSYYMIVNPSLNNENLYDLIQENEKTYYNERLNRYEYIFDNLQLEDFNLGFEDTFYKLLKKSKRIKSLYLKYSVIDCKLLADALTNNDTIQELHLIKCNLNNFKEFSKVLKYNKTIKSLEIYYSLYKEEDFNEAFNFLQFNTSINSLSINDYNISSSNIITVCNNLKNNYSIIELNFCHHNNENYINQISDIIQYNNTIKSLNIVNTCNYFKPSIEEIRKLSESIKLNKTLENLYLKSIELDDECYDLIMDALKYNNSINSIILPEYKNSNECNLKKLKLIDMLKYNTTLINIFPLD